MSEQSGTFPKRYGLKRRLNSFATFHDDVIAFTAFDQLRSSLWKQRFKLVSSGLSPDRRS